MNGLVPAWLANNRRLLIGLVAVALTGTAACGPVDAKLTKPPVRVAPTDPYPSASASHGSTRLGQFPIQSPGSGKTVGELGADDAGDGGVSITVKLVDATAIHPWGLYDQDRCAPPPIDHEAPWQFADIENGSHSELVEREAYLGFPNRLMALVFNIDGSEVIGCADLGMPAIAAINSQGPESCGTRPALPDRNTPQVTELAFSYAPLGNADIYTMHGDGAERVRLTDALGLDIDPSWSPDGSQIAFRSTRDGQDEIYIMNWDGSCQRNLTKDPLEDRSPAWSPNGAQIAFDHFFEPEHQDIALINVDGLGLQRLTFAQGEYPAWSPDGKVVAFASARDGDYDIFLMNADGTDQRPITANATYDMYPAWSPDGASLAYECESTPTTGFLGEASDICIVQADGSSRRNVTIDAASNRFPAWSSGGMLAWSKGEVIEAARRPTFDPVEVGPGIQPAWRP